MKHTAYAAARTDGFLKISGRNLRRILGIALLFNLIAEILISFVFFPLSNMLISFSLGRVKLEYITQNDIFTLLSDPLVAFAYILITSFTMLFSLYRIAAIYTLAKNPDIRTVSGMALAGFKSFVKGFRGQKFSGKLLLLLLYPFANITTILSLYLRFGFDRIFDLNIANKIILFSAFILMSSFLIFIYPVVFLEGTTLRRAFIKGIKLFRFRWVRNVLSYLLAILIPAAFILVLYFMISAGIILITDLSDSSLKIMNFIFTVLNTVKSAMTLITVVIISIINSFIAVELYLFCSAETTRSEDTLPVHKRGKKRYWIFSGLLIAVVFAFSIFGPTYFRNSFTIYSSYFSSDKAEIIAHRGFSSKAPENTAAAVRAAIDANADRIEIDVQMSSDGVLYLMHDRSLLRTAGVNSSISKLTSEEIDRLDAGSWFSEEYADEKVPRLSEILEICRGKIALKIELKTYGSNELLIADTVVSEIKEAGMSGSVMIISFSSKAIKHVNDSDSVIMTGLLAGFIYGDYNDIDYADAIILNKTYLTLEKVNSIHRSGKLVYCWTSNTAKSITEMDRLGVDGIITDYPALTRMLIYGESYGTAAQKILYKIIISLTGVL